MASKRTMSMSMTGAQQRGFVLMHFRGAMAFMQNAFGQIVEAKPEVFDRFKRELPKTSCVPKRPLRATQETLVFNEDFEDAFGGIEVGMRRLRRKNDEHHFLPRSGGKKRLKWHDRRNILY